MDGHLRHFIHLYFVNLVRFWCYFLLKLLEHFVVFSFMHCHLLQVCLCQGCREKNKDLGRLIKFKENKINFTPYSLQWKNVGHSVPLQPLLYLPLLLLPPPLQFQWLAHTHETGTVKFLQWLFLHRQKTTQIKVLSQELTEQKAGLNLLQNCHHLLNVVFFIIYLFILVVLQLSCSIWGLSSK